MNLQPINGNILVRDEKKKEEKTRGGIIIAESIQEDMVTGEVIATSDWITEKGNIIKPRMDVGDRVIYRFISGGGQTWVDDDYTYRILKPIEVLARVLS